MKKVEIVTSVERRRRFTAEEKVEIVAQSYEPGATVASMARKHEISPSLLYAWRKAYPPGGDFFAQDRSTALATTPQVFARALLPRNTEPCSEPIRLHLYEQMVIELPASVDVAVVSDLIRALRE